MGLISFQLFKAFIKRGKSQSCQSISPLTRSAFTPFSSSSTLFAFPVTSFNLPSVSKDCTLYTSFLWIGAGCVPVMTGKFARFWTYAFTISFSHIRRWGYSLPSRSPLLWKAVRLSPLEPLDLPALLGMQTWSQMQCLLYKFQLKIFFRTAAMLHTSH